MGRSIGMGVFVLVHDSLVAMFMLVTGMIHPTVMML
jgi:hypothetical protein